MKSAEENKLDQFFKAGLSNIEDQITFRDEDWAAMEKLLDGTKNRSGIIWLYRTVAGIAALLLMLLGWQFLKPERRGHNWANQQTKTQAGPARKNSSSNLPAATNYAGTSGGQHTANAPKGTVETPNSNVLPQTTSASRLTMLHKRSPASKYGRPNPPENNQANASYTQIAPGKQTTPRIKEKGLNPEYLSAQHVGLSIDSIQSFSLMALNAPDSLSIGKIGKPINKLIKSTPGVPPTFTLAVLTAPDINGVGSLSGGKLGTNAGLLLSVRLSKWTISTGAAYAVKPYGYSIGTGSGGGSYYGYPTAASEIDIYANCKVLDIPLNVNYSVYSKGKNAFSIGSGMSSYFMLREYYQFDYTNGSSKSINIINQNRHILGVVNFDVSYMRQLSPGFSLIVQPYYKLPVTHIGYEKINLQSGGVAVGVGWNFKTPRLNHTTR